jgi:phage terminase large subunit
LGKFNEDLSLKCYGLDFGFSDPDVLVKVAVDEPNKTIYLRQELFQSGLSIDALGDIVMNRVGYNEMTVADSAHPRLIKQLRDRGLNMEKARKGADSVKRGVKTLLGYQLIIDEDSLDMIEAFQNYAWHDKRAEVPRHEWSHFPDAVRYGAIELIVY